MISSVDQMEYHDSRGNEGFKIDRELLKRQPQTRPLGRVIEDIWQPIPEVLGLKNHETDQNDTQIIRAFTNWYRLQFLVSIGLGDVLSEEQRNSYRLLFDWWAAAFQHPVIPLGYLSICIKASSTLARVEKSKNTTNIYAGHLMLWNCIQKHMHILQGDKSEHRDTSHFRTDTYARALWALFTAELRHPGAYNVENTFHGFVLQSRRRDAAVESYCKQAGMECMRRLLPKVFAPNFEPVKPDNIYDSTCSLQASDPGLPRRIDCGPLIRACSWLPPLEYFRYEDSEDEDDEYGLADKDENQIYDPLGGWPEYLWDLKDGRTVRTSTLGYDPPAYTAISHTWGRSVLPGQNHIIPNGLPYPVPLNSAFEVTALPQTLKALQGKIATPYIWLDLVCIPQDEEGDMKEDDKALRLREISRQGSIFRNAAASIAWLHDVDDLSCLSTLFQWFCISTLDLDDDLEYRNCRETFKKTALLRIKDKHTGLVKAQQDQKGNVIVQPLSASTASSDENSDMRRSTSWFTSLWTLQELCLRPDMLIATSNLDIMATETGDLVPINGLVCVYNQYKSTNRGEESISLAMEEVSDWCRSTGLGNLLDFTQLDILELGSNRYCKGRRDEAIMSAIGANSWYEEVQAGKHSSDKVNSAGYHPKFIQEVKDLISKDFSVASTTAPDGSSYEQHGSTRMILEMEGGELITVSHYNASCVKE